MSVWIVFVVLYRRKTPLLSQLEFSIIHVDHHQNDNCWLNNLFFFGTIRRFILLLRFPPTPCLFCAESLRLQKVRKRDRLLKKKQSVQYDKLKVWSIDNLKERITHRSSMWTFLPLPDPQRRLNLDPCECATSNSAYEYFLLKLRVWIIESIKLDREEFINDKKWYWYSRSDSDNCDHFHYFDIKKIDSRILQLKNCATASSLSL